MHVVCSLSHKYSINPCLISVTRGKVSPVETLLERNQIISHTPWFCPTTIHADIWTELISLSAFHRPQQKWKNRWWSS